MSSFVQEVKNKFDAAKENEQLFSFDSTTVEKESNGMNFKITLVPALAQKKSNQKVEEDGKKCNPFENPEPALVVKELDEHRILLNKYAVIPNHLIIATKEFKKQSEPLMPNDLYESFKVLKDFGSSQPALAFYNCGEESGASQGHKHMQVLPLQHESNPQPPVKKLFDEIHDRHVGQIYAINKLPFVHVILPLDNNIIRNANTREELTDYLVQMFFGILDAMFQQLRENAQPLNTSYNFLMTQDFMMLVPRSNEKASIEHNGKTFEFSVNSLGFAGLLLCKTEEELEVLKAQDNLMDILTQVGIPWDPKASDIEAARELAADAELA
ncbi:ATP adenylyltransferase-domain-containing protein [Cokeromyces recurvatus]|uniref:ATP adenylyltransferase-domain-containing protein n=1 Tax=Cokeromyces recurvatus TaxID=90255 RepID=UPI00221F834C|nr:ATP adenylyltransferase-domain-containing protein [Cokeromyces recurvatus]KAI7901684.1 ATP adenylyltransferase-domain-containing protein [Cokeromyces recurvatus]